MYRIIERQQFSETSFLWVVEAPDVAHAAQPGQFVIVRLHEGGERIPLTIADYDREAGTVTIVVQAVGKSTREMRDNYRAGDVVADFAGPLGLPSRIEKVGHVLLVGGGLGVAPVFPQLRAFHEKGNRTSAILGFRSRDLVFWEDRFRPYCDELVVCTDDGSYGRPGLVTEPLAEMVKGDDPPDLVVAIGPMPMMRACAETTRETGTPTVVSLNTIMVDGTGMCGSCRVTVGGQVRFACVDGPEFDAHLVDFEELQLRQARFRNHERQADEEYERVCALETQLFEAGKRNYKKIKDLPPKATPMPERPAEERVHNFEEVNLGYSLRDAVAEASRCIQCMRPTCISGCPVGIDIPRFIRHILIRDIEGARKVIEESNLFPSICGRVCPQESQCEAQCIIGKKVEPVAIGRLERFVGDHAPPAALAAAASAPTALEEAPAGGSAGTGAATAPAPGTPPAALSSAADLPSSAANGRRKRVAVVGSGPGGLACAGDLAKAGVEVTVFEALHVVGGVLSYGIPSFRLPREIMEREVNALKQLGVKFETNKIIGKTFTLHELLNEKGFDAVFIATGAGFPTFLGIPGEFAGQVYSANEFLTRVNLMHGDQFPLEDTPVAVGDKVVVIGAGNTAMDCLRVARRLGAGTVHCVYRRTEAEAPARVEEIRHAKEEGIQFHWLVSPVEIITNREGDVEAIRCQRMQLGEPDESGRRRPVPIEGEFVTFECDTVIYALGTRANPIIAQSTPELKTRGNGYIVVDEKTQATSMRGVFAGGDIVTGGATVILAMGAGRRAARGILDYFESGVWPWDREEAATRGAEGETAGRSCPKCHRPLEGTESYICCADGMLRWKCEDCRKVYEGFAFPYGLCPACGGRLAVDERTPTADDESRRIIREALEIEFGASAFYERCAEEAEDEELRDLFRRLSAMEQEHVETLGRRYHVDPPQVDGGERPSVDRFAEMARYDGELKTGVDVLRFAIWLEKRARDFFARQRARLEEGTSAYDLYRELEAEEEEHVALLSTELRRYVERKPGLL